LEGNFAFASGINEMLIQSHTGVVKIIPAIPNSWENLSFKNLRTMGAFLVSSEIIKGKVTQVEIGSETGGIINIANPFPSGKYSIQGDFEKHEPGEIIKIQTIKGQKIVLIAKNE
jgi:alpha-L-fucosidase 2